MNRSNPAFCRTFHFQILSIKRSYARDIATTTLTGNIFWTEIEDKAIYAVMERKEEIEIVDETVISDLIKFIEGKTFNNAIDDFLDDNVHLFEVSIDSKSEEIEWNHSHKKAFDEYQELIDRQLNEFAAAHNFSLRYIQQCCRDIGK